MGIFDWLFKKNKDGLHIIYGNEREEIHYKNNLKHGLYKRYWQYNTKDKYLKNEGNYKNGLKNGLWIEYHSNKKIKSKQNYKDGVQLLDGVQTEYHYNGSIKSKIRHKENRIIDKVVKKYHPNGKIQFIKNYENGEEREYWKNGKIKKIKYLKTNQNKSYNYKSFYYSEKGNLIQEDTFHNGKQDGLCKWYYENGFIKTYGNWENGKRMGLWKFFNEDGSFKEYGEVLDDKIINRIKIENKKDEKPQIRLSKENTFANTIEKFMKVNKLTNEEAEAVVDKMRGLKEYFRKHPNTGRVYDDFTSSIRNGYTVREFLEKSNLLVNDEIRNAIVLGFNAIVSFLKEMLEIKEDDEIKNDLDALLEAIKILNK